jgi:uncharacterized protein (TIGR02231 family)
MKKIILIFVMAASVLAASADQNVRTHLSAVKIFLRGAELTHSAKLNVNAGVSDIAFTNIAENIDQNSLNVSAKGDLIIISVVQRKDYMQSPDANPRAKILKDSLDLVNDKLAGKQVDVDVLNSELDLINANKQVGGKDRGATIAEIQKMADFLKKRVGEIKNQMYSLSKDINKLQKERDRISKQLEELNSKLNAPSNQIVVTVSSKAATTAEFNFQYMIYNAGWNPAYDIRVNKLNEPASLDYRANVFQNSGLDWNDINVVLSTRNPVQNNNKPELYPWYLDFARPVLYKGQGEMMRGVVAPPVAMEAARITSDAENMADYMDVNQTQLAVEFVPAIKYSIPSDNKPHIVALQNYSVPATYEYYAAPKLDNNAFLIANLTKWNDYNLMPGNANIYFENSFIGQSFINPEISKDTLTISLGRDQGIVIDRNIIKDFSEDKFLSSDVERTFAFNIVVKNNKNIPIKISVEEQLPISKNEDIEVKAIDISGGVYNKENGKVKWEVNVEPTKSVAKKFVYSVRYPKDKVIPDL